MSLDPMSMFLISSAFTAANTVTDVMAQQENARIQTENNEVQAESIREATVANYDQLHLMSQQEKASAEQQIRENDVDALQATERAAVAAGEAGVTGLSVDALLRDMYGKQAKFTDNVNQNLENTNQQLEFEKKNTTRGSQSQLNQMTPVERPNYMGAALKGGSGIFGAYKTHLKVR